MSANMTAFLPGKYSLKISGVLAETPCPISKAFVSVEIERAFAILSFEFISHQNFVPIIHEYMLVLRKDESIIVPVKYTKDATMDMRDMNVSTWRDVIASVMESYGTTMTLEQLYQKIDGHKKTKTNAHWKEKIRQTLQVNKIFENIERGKWQLVRQSA